MSQKFRQLNQTSGSVLLTALWTVVILSLLSWSLTHYAHGGVVLTKRFLGALQSRAAAVSSLRRLIKTLDKDEVLLKEFKDEESKININTLPAHQYLILENLFKEIGVDETTAQIIAASIIDWKDADDVVFRSPSGAEEAYYSSSLPQSYHCKNRAFESLEELLLVRGMTTEIYERAKNYLIIFPVQGTLRINMQTASREVLLAWARSFTGAETNTSLADAESLVDKIIFFRRGEDGREGSEDDQPIDPQSLALLPGEEILLRLMFSNRAQTPQIFLVESQGTDEFFNFSTKIEAVIDRRTKTILGWRRE